MRLYESYKPSGVEWLGDVPAHWNVQLLKSGFDVTLGKMLQSEQKDDAEIYAPYLRSANVQQSVVDVSDIQLMWFSPSEIEGLTLIEGDLVVCEGGDVGRAAIWQGEIEGCYFQNSVNRVRAIKGNSNRFLIYWLLTMKNAGYVDILCNKATIAHLTKEKLQLLPVVVPPASEQKAIADYLDIETARIDGLIEAKHELIKLLVEYRQSVISDAVIKGLNPDVPLKPFFSDWIDTIPAHWEQMRLGHIAKIYAGGTPDRTKPEYWDGDIPWINSGSVNQWLVTEASENITHLGWEQSSARWVPKGSLVIALAGQGKTKGMCAQMAIDATCNQSMAAIVPDCGNNRFCCIG